MHKYRRALARLIAPIAALLASPVLALDPGEAVPPAEEVRPALWKVADEDTTIYLFGTIHALPDGIDWFDGDVARAFDASQELVTEIVNPDAGTMQDLVVSKAVLPKGQSLRVSLSARDRAAYEAALTAMGVPIDAFDIFEPWYAAIGLSTLPLVRDDFAGKNGVEELLDARAKAAGRPHQGLETAEYQLGLFDSLPEPVQRRYLSEVIEQLPTMKTQLMAMIDAWKTGDAERLAALINSEEDDPVLTETLLTNRNKAWADWIGQRLDRPGTVFMAVGAGHLAGPGSVQAQLAARGVLSTRVQ